jgi:hypothetical protein
MYAYWFLKIYNGRAWTEFIRLSIGRSGVLSEYSNEHSGSIKYGEFID